MNLVSFFRGSLLGTGLGDSIGRSREGGGRLEPEEVLGSIKKKELLRYTDDTQQMISLAEAIVWRGRFDGEVFAERLVENFDPLRGYGPGSVRVIRAIEAGENWEKPASRAFGGEGSYGNGSSMRVAPVGLFCHQDLNELREVARESSRITHTHRLGLEGAVLQASSVAVATRLDPLLDLRIDSFLEDLWSLLKEQEYERKLDSISELLEADPTMSDVVDRLGNGVEAHNSVPTALYCFLSHSESFEDAVSHAVGLGGDADTIGAMTGAISGAYLGSEKIPESWKEKLEDRNLILDLADELLNLFG